MYEELHEKSPFVFPATIQTSECNVAKLMQLKELKKKKNQTNPNV